MSGGPDIKPVAGSSLRVLVAMPDGPAANEVVGAFQSASGVSVLHCSCSIDAVGELENKRWDCLVLGEQLDRMNWKACTLLVRSGDCGSPSLPIIVLKPEKSATDLDWEKAYSVLIAGFEDAPRLIEAVKNATRQRPRPRILVVEDNPIYAHQLINILAKSFVVTSAMDGDEALSEYESAKPDIVITDLMVPAVDGVGLVEAIRERDPDQPVIVITAFAQSNNHKRAALAGATRFFAKKVQAADLIRTCHQTLFERALENRDGADRARGRNTDRIVQTMLRAREELQAGKTEHASFRLDDAIALIGDGTDGE